jgi:hypothetical protein
MDRSRQHANLSAGRRDRQFCRSGAADGRRPLGDHAPGGGTGSPPRREADRPQHPQPDPDLGRQRLSGVLPGNPQPRRSRRERSGRRTPGTARPDSPQRAAEFRSSPPVAAIDGFQRDLSGCRSPKSTSPTGASSWSTKDWISQSASPDASIRSMSPGGSAAAVCSAIASPEYLRRHGEPRHPRELAEHECLIYLPAQHEGWPFLVRRRDGSLSGTRPHARQQRRCPARRSDSWSGHHRAAQLSDRRSHRGRLGATDSHATTRCRNSASTPCSPAIATCHSGCGCWSTTWPSGLVSDLIGKALNGK